VKSTWMSLGLETGSSPESRFNVTARDVFVVKIPVQIDAGDVMR
jgi:hypothetical protein